MNLEEADKKVHLVEEEWHYPIFTKYGYVPEKKTAVGLVRSYKYVHPVSQESIIWCTGVNADYWIDDNSVMGYGDGLDRHLALLEKNRKTGAYDGALAELAKNMIWPIKDAVFFWEGGESNRGRDQRLLQDLVNLGYKGDINEMEGLGQFLYDQKILSTESLKALWLPHTLHTYLCVWGIGYQAVSDNAITAEKTFEELKRDDSFSEYINSIWELPLGGSKQLEDNLAVMSIVRIR